MKQDIRFFINNLWRWKCGMPELNGNEMDPKNIINKKWSPEFEQLMKNRLIMGSLRYENPVEFNSANKYDRIGAIAKKLEAFKSTRNKEYLVDIANYCMLEFMHGVGYFAATDDCQDTHAELRHRETFKKDNRKPNKK